MCLSRFGGMLSSTRTHRNILTIATQGRRVHLDYNSKSQSVMWVKSRQEQKKLVISHTGRAEKD